MLNLTSRITIQTNTQVLAYEFVNDIVISSGWEDMTDTAEIILPRNVRTGENQRFITDEGTESLIQVGNKIDIELGYDGNLINEFSGYVTHVEPNLPVRIFCEDGMYDFKRTSLSVKDNSFDFQTEDNVDLKGMLDEIIEASGLDYEVNPQVDIDIKLGKFRVKKQTSISEILERLKDFGLAVYTRGRSELYVLPPRLGVVETLIDGQDNVLFIFTRNVIQNDLEYVSKNLKKQQFLGVSTDSKSNEKVTFPEEPEEDVNYTKIQLPENMTVEQIKRFVEDREQLDRYDGFEGSFLAFGAPYTRHGEAVTIEDPEVPDRNGDYLVKKTEVTFGVGGFRRKVYLWRAADNE